MTQDLDARIQRLEDIEAIRRLKYDYCLACDDGYAPARIAALFVEDGIWDGGAIGMNIGREAIAKFFSEASDLIPFALHYVTNPIIDVDGDSATGKWLLWEPVIYKSTGANWMAAAYHDTYRRIGEQWFFEHVRVKLEMLSPYDKGFAEARFGYAAD